ncbi:NAD-dependent epimerase [Tenacibaculum soleae]|uniref:NAD-dependent epimerase n=1 Tax=Tenacibaculum soleae TaxID=447689 RepID=UPI002301C171|nr:NAD-dependent epimerase [Tenacibaculum soleae]
MKILVTGAAGFIGFHLSKKLLDKGYSVIGIDNINDYYNVDLKYDRLKELGIQKETAVVFHKESRSSSYSDFKFRRINLEDKEILSALFEKESFDVVCNLAAQAGVRYSIENPNAYIQSNIVGFLNVLECARYNNIKHLVYASSSSVYGANAKIPFSEEDKVDTPVSLYAATKKSNELMAHTYSHLYKIPTTGLRFFTVYGPWGRPDMAPMLFADAIANDRPIKVFNYGKMQRDFTYVDDIVEGIERVLVSELKDRALYKVYNIGNNNSVKLLDFISEIEKNIDKEAQKELLPIQPGDVEKTWANVNDLMKDYNYKPNTILSKGIKEFINWFKNYAVEK